MEEKLDIKAIIGLGNPEEKRKSNRHNIGFRVVDQLAQLYNGSWKPKDNMEIADIQMGDKRVLLIKPQTYMNESGRVFPLLNKQGIKAENILVVHDELEKPFGHASIKISGSARGHNGLRSLIEFCGKDFARLRFGIGRPENKEEVGNYVLQNFDEGAQRVNEQIDQSVSVIEEYIRL